MTKEQEEKLLTVLDNLVESVTAMSKAIEGLTNIAEIHEGRIEKLETR
jgi:hypothetical protein